MMEDKFFGGNIVKKLTFQNKGKHLLASGPYEYFIYKSINKEELRIDNLRSFTVFILDKDENCKILVNDLNKSINKSDAIQVENSDAVFSISGGCVTLLVAGTKNNSSDKQGIFHLNSESIYKVEKPWGHELWINGEHQCYALKQIFIKAGTKTSLQYHNYKQETNVLFSGKAKLHYKKKSEISNNNIDIEDIDSVIIHPISSIDVIPPTLHRLEAVTDILLYETSTPHLDDVVRVLDDAKRPNGRIKQEHDMNENK